jgi:integrase
LLVGEVRQFLAYLDEAGRGQLGSAGADDVRGFLLSVAPRRAPGMGNTAWALRRFFAFLNAAGLSALRVDGMLATRAPRRVRALPCLGREETGRILQAIDTGSARGKRDYAIVRLALATGLRCCDIVSLRLDAIDWRADEIRIVQRKTAAPLALPLTPEAGNAVAEWILGGRPATAAPEVFVRLRAPHGKLTGPTGDLVMKRWLAKAGVTRSAFDGKTFHALRRTTGTRLVESGADLSLTAQILGHAKVDSSKRYIRLADEALRECCLPLDGFPVTREGLR